MSRVDLSMGQFTVGALLPLRCIFIVELELVDLAASQLAMQRSSRIPIKEVETTGVKTRGVQTSDSPSARSGVELSMPRDVPKLPGLPSRESSLI